MLGWRMDGHGSNALIACLNAIGVDGPWLILGCRFTSKPHGICGCIPIEQRAQLRLLMSLLYQRLAINEDD